MSFPDPVEVPLSVYTARRERKEDLIRIASIGMGVRAFIVLIELIGVYLFASSVLLLDALATLLDICGSLILVLSLKFASKPPDENHPFGHGRIEPLVGLQLALVLVIVGAMMGYDQFFQTKFQVSEDPISPFTWVIPAFAMFLLYFAFRSMMKVATERGSEALKVEAEHYRIDTITTCVAAFVLLAGAFYPSLSHYLDHSGALLIALFMVLLGLKAAKGNIAQLMDHTPDPKYFESVKASAMRVDGVLGTEKIRIQLYGPDAHVDIDIEVEPTLQVEAAHKISQNVRAEIQKDLPEVRDVIVHIEPYYPGDHYEPTH